MMSPFAKLVVPVNVKVVVFVPVPVVVAVVAVELPLPKISPLTVSLLLVVSAVNKATLLEF